MKIEKKKISGAMEGIGDQHDHASAVIHNGIRCLVLLLGN